MFGDKFVLREIYIRKSSMNKEVNRCRMIIIIIKSSLPPRSLPKVGVVIVGRD